MRSKVTFLSLLFALTLSLCISPIQSQAQAPVKRALLEEFTGSWCGWCVLGAYDIEQLRALYPNQFIAVSFHNQDPMVFPACDTMEASISSYPNAWFDRKSFDGSTLETVVQDLATVKSNMVKILKDTVYAGVSVTNVTFDPTTRVLSAKVTADFAVATSGDLRFNMYVVEDSVSGPAGSSYDQHNYVKGDSRFTTNPYYTEPSVITGFQHMQVVRSVLGGVPGIAGAIPATVAANSSYSMTFSTVLPPYIKPQHASVVGFVFRNDPAKVTNRRILNADLAKITKITTIYPSADLTASVSKQYITATRSGQTTQTITFNNAGSSAVKAHVIVDNGTSNFPTDWSATVAPADVTVPAGGSATATLTINAPANAGYANVSFGYWPVVTDQLTTGAEMIVNALSENTKYVSFGGDGAIIAGMPAKYNSDFVTLPLSTDIFAAYPAKNFEVGIFPNVVWFDYASISGPPAAVVPSINAMLTAKKKVLITSTYGMFYSFDPSAQYYQYTNTAAVKKLFNTKFGVSYVELQSRANGNNPTLSNVTGITGDVVGNGVSFPSYFFQTDVFTIDSTKTTKPVLYLDDDPSIIGGFRYDNGAGQRAVYLDVFLPYTQDVAGSSKLVAQAMDFLINGETADVKNANIDATSLSVSANPIKASTVITYTAQPSEQNITFGVVDMLGREVMNLTPNASGNTFTATLDASKLTNGAYVIVARSNEGTHQLRIVNAQ